MRREVRLAMRPSRQGGGDRPAGDVYFGRLEGQEEKSRAKLAEAIGID